MYVYLPSTFTYVFLKIISNSVSLIFFFFKVLSSEIKDPIHRMLTDEIQELCINVFTATFFSLLEDETTENDFEEKIRKINKENTNILFLAYNVSFRNVKNQKWKMFSCYISEEISLYISSTFIIDESFYVFYSLSEDINKQMLGLVERSSTLIDVFPNKMYYDYRRELQECKYIIYTYI